AQELDDAAADALAATRRIDHDRAQERMPAANFHAAVADDVAALFEGVESHAVRIEVVVGEPRRPQRDAQPGRVSARERSRAKVVAGPGSIRGFGPDDGRHAT